MTGGRLVFAIPGDLATPSGGYGYDRRLMVELEGLGWQVEHLALPGGFPQPSAKDLETAEAALAALPDGSIVLVDGLAFGAMPQVAARQAERLRLVALVHHPLCLETGLDAAVQARLEASERMALASARAVVVTSAATADTLIAEFSVPRARLTVALPGTDKPERHDGAGTGTGEGSGCRGTKTGPGSGSGDRAGPPRILSIGTLIARKDHATLVDGLTLVADLAWQCRIVGSKSADPQTSAALERQIAARGLAGRIDLAGSLPDVSTEYRGADLFVLASRYEGYGMVFAEAMANGLPIVSCAEGAPRDLIPAEAGRRFAPSDADDLAAALRALLTDPPALARAASASLAAGRALPSWRQTAETVAGALAGVTMDGAP